MLCQKSGLLGCRSFYFQVVLAWSGDALITLVMRTVTGQPDTASTPGCREGGRVLQWQTYSFIKTLDSQVPRNCNETILPKLNTYSLTD